MRTASTLRFERHIAAHDRCHALVGTPFAVSRRLELARRDDFGQPFALPSLVDESRRAAIKPGWRCSAAASTPRAGLDGTLSTRRPFPWP